MNYSIAQAAKEMNLTTYTLRYYDREGLLSNVKRDKSGKRIFTKDDMEMLSLICCLKNTGMPIKEIKHSSIGKMKAIILFMTVTIY